MILTAISPRLAIKIFHYFTLNNGWPYSTICPSSTNISTISPETSACISLNNFIASKMHTVDSLVTLSPT